MNITLGFQFGGEKAALDFLPPKNNIVTMILKL
jgi:hypothetical protein